MRLKLVPAITLLIFFAGIALSGCASRIPMPKTQAVIRSYALGVVQTASVGEPIASVRNAITRPAYAARFAYQPPQWNIWNGGLDYPSITKGMRFGVIATFTDGRLEIANPKYKAGNPSIPIPGPVTILIRPSGQPYHFPLGSSWTDDTLFAKSSEPFIEEGSFKAEILFSGLTGSTLRAVYREYADDYARPAYSTELQYNLDESKLISYKSIKIEVIEATNSRLSFKVVSDDDLPWLP